MRARSFATIVAVGCAAYAGSTRTVRVHVVSDVVSVSVDGGASINVVDGIALIPRASQGEHAISVVRGRGCEVEAWCGVERLSFTVPPGEGLTDITLALAEASPRRVVVESATPVDFSLLVEGMPAVRGMASVTLSLPPGAYPATAVCGPCSANVETCNATSCPANCAYWSGNLVVPWATKDGFTIELPVAPRP